MHISLHISQISGLEFITCDTKVLFELFVLKSLHSFTDHVWIWGHKLFPWEKPVVFLSCIYYLLPTLRQVPYMPWVFGTRKYTSVRSSSNVLNKPCCKWSRDKQSQWFDVHYCILLLTCNSNLPIDQLKSCIIFLYFRHAPINRFNVTPHFPPPPHIWLSMRQM